MQPAKCRICRAKSPTYTNAAYSIGEAGVPTIGFGPGAEGDAHVVDERVSLEELEKAALGLQGAY